MSYYRFSSEIIKVKNENLNTIAFLESVQRYIMDLMNGVRIESLGKLSIDVYLDDLHILINKEKSGFKEYKTEIRGNCRTKEVAEYALQNMREYENISLKLDYDAMVFYFYPFAIERMASLLHGKLAKHVIYKCQEITDHNANLYVYKSSDGKLVNGLVIPSDISVADREEPYKLLRFHIWYEFDKIISAQQYKKISELSKILETKYYLYSDYTHPVEVDGGIEISDLVIQNFCFLEKNTYAETRDFYTIEEINDIYEILTEIHCEIKDYVDVVNPEITFSSQRDLNEDYYLIMVTTENEEVLDIGVYSTLSDNVVPYKNGRGITIEMMEEIGEVYLPMDNISYLEE